MGDSRTGAHELDLARCELSPISHAILMLQSTTDDVAEDFHIAVLVGGKAAAWRYTVFVDDPNAAKTHMRRIVIIGETESVMTVQPAMIAMATLRGFA